MIIVVWPNYAYHSDFSKSQLMGQADAFIDIGAYTGVFMVKALQAGKAVYAVEGQTRVAEVLRRKLPANRREGCDPEYWVQNAIVTNETKELNFGLQGTTALYADRNNMKASMALKGALEHEEVGEATTLDNLLAHRLSGQRALLCLEIKGSEVAALSGASSLLDGLSKGSSCRFQIIYPKLQKSKLRSRFDQAKSLLERCGWRVAVRQGSGKGFFVVASKA